jgi:hypothetical protein
MSNVEVVCCSIHYLLIFSLRTLRVVAQDYRQESGAMPLKIYLFVGGFPLLFSAEITKLYREFGELIILPNNF